MENGRGLGPQTSDIRTAGKQATQTQSGAFHRRFRFVPFRPSFTGFSCLFVFFFVRSACTSYSTGFLGCTGLQQGVPRCTILYLVLLGFLVFVVS